MSRTLPHNLGEMAPGVEVGLVRGVLAVQTLEETHLVVVHQVRDHDGNLIRLDSVTNVLTISAAVDIAVKGEEKSMSASPICSLHG